MSGPSVVMSFFQKLFTRIFPRKWAESMEADSRSWFVHCRCGMARSVWDMGGIRWKAAGRPRWYLKCPECGRRSWHTLSREAASPDSSAV
jgi:hypothetical protein